MKLSIQLLPRSTHLAMASAVMLAGLVSGIAARPTAAQTLTTIAAFNGTNGSMPYGSLVRRATFMAPREAAGPPGRAARARSSRSPPARGSSAP
jgi:hypothetical protein